MKPIPANFGQIVRERAPRKNKPRPRPRPNKPRPRTRPPAYHSPTPRPWINNDHPRLREYHAKESANPLELVLLLIAAGLLLVAIFYAIALVVGLLIFIFSHIAEILAILALLFILVMISP
mgnify:CR=1 FL=1